MIKLVWLEPNQRFAFQTGEGGLTPMGNYGRFFKTRDEAVAAALSQGLRVDANNEVHSIDRETGIPPWEPQQTETAYSIDPALVTPFLPDPGTPGREKQGSILDPIHETLDPRVFDHPADPEPTLRPELAQWIPHTIFEILTRHGYTKPEEWLTLVLTGSLTTYQYGEQSDCDVSLFIDTAKLPDWSRAEMISFMVSDFDDVKLPGTPHPMQAFVVAHDLTPQDLYKPGLRSGYVVYGQGAGTWLVAPDRERVHDVEKEMNDAYTVGLLSADKLDLLLRFEPDQAIEFWHDLHKRRQREQTAGKGDFSTSNIVFKMLVNRGLAAQAAKLAGDSFIPA